MSQGVTTFTQLAYLAMRDLGILRPAQTGSPDVIADMLNACNNMMDTWKLNRLMVLKQQMLELTLTVNQQQYTIGPNEVAPNFAAPRPTYIETANVILNTFSPVVRQPVGIIDFQRWADIRVQAIPNSIPQVLYYDNGFDAVRGCGTIYLWPGPLTAYGLELYVWDQTPWNGFIDATTVYNFAPGFLEVIQKQLAVRCKPMLRPYMKIEMDEQTWDDLVMLSRQLMSDMEQYNAPTPLLACDSGYLGSQQRGYWDYSIGEDRIFGRG